MDELRGQDLKVAYWYNTHRAQVKTAAYGVALVAVAGLWLVVIILLIRVILQWDDTNRAITELSTTHVIYDSIQAPQALIVTMVDAVSHTTDNIDAYALITNPNKYYVGRFSYTMTINGTAYDYQDGVVMPSSQSYIVISKVSGNASSSANCVINETTWQRISGPQPVSEFLAQNVTLSTSEIPLSSTTTDLDTTTETITDEFATPDDADADSTNVPGQTISQVTADLTNASAYGFRDVTVTALLTSPAGTIEGIQQTVLSDVQSFSDVPVLFTWQRRFNFNTQPSIVVETDVWNDANLIRPGDN